MHLIFKGTLQMSGLLDLLDTSVLAIVQANLRRLVDAEGDWGESVCRPCHCSIHWLAAKGMASFPSCWLYDTHNFNNKIL